jgi:hypothetical protein
MSSVRSACGSCDVTGVRPALRGRSATSAPPPGWSGSKDVVVNPGDDTWWNFTTWLDYPNPASWNPRGPVPADDRRRFRAFPAARPVRTGLLGYLGRYRPGLNIGCVPSYVGRGRSRTSITLGLSRTYRDFPCAQRSVTGCTQRRGQPRSRNWRGDGDPVWRADAARRRRAGMMRRGIGKVSCPTRHPPQVGVAPYGSVYQNLAWRSAQACRRSASAHVRPTAGSVRTSSVGPWRRAAHAWHSSSSTSSIQASGRPGPA